MLFPSLDRLFFLGCQYRLFFRFFVGFLCLGHGLYSESCDGLTIESNIRSLGTITRNILWPTRGLFGRLALGVTAPDMCAPSIGPW